MVQQLHTRMRKRVDIFAAVMKQARRDKEEESKKTFKTSHGGATEEEKKVVGPRKISKAVLGGGVFQ